ncbi:AraC-like DNA-binding protein [Pedobacter africanus]|uniref:AraC-like DNA-binding protein n=1 Tax=Pedobacter africanus TaxID=151894 RepID=A0ACC6L4G8_9SPHI|nr:AraC family transcriptional regulator [Pedobacter africanus]MDR6786504.1 AraC-like DNA-binding protein [Pedobacter africanus]
MERMLEYKTNKKDYDEPMMLQLDELIAAHLHEGKLPDFYVKQMGIEQYRLEKCVMAHHGLNLSKYLVAKRNAEAYRLLLESDLQIKEIAFAVGFSGGGAFCKTFKMLEGTSPEAYRVKMGIDIQQLQKESLMARLDGLIDKEMDRLRTATLYARELNVCTKTLDNCVRKVHGIGLGRYLQQRRRQEACRLLQETALPIKEISKRIGFLHASTLSKAFKVSGGKKPKEVRAVFRSENLNKFTCGKYAGTVTLAAADRTQF